MMDLSPTARTVMQVIAAVLIIAVFVASMLKPDLPVAVTVTLFVIAALLGVMSSRGKGGG